MKLLLITLMILGLYATEEIDLTDEWGELIPLSLPQLQKHPQLSLCNAQIIDISPLARLTFLVGLDLSLNPFTSIAPITALCKLKILDISSCGHIEDIQQIANIPSLNVLHMNGMGASIEGPMDYLLSLPKLHQLSLNWCSFLTHTHLDVIARLGRLGILYIIGIECTIIDDISILQTSRSLTHIHVSKSEEVVIPRFSKAKVHKYS